MKKVDQLKRASELLREVLRTVPFLLRKVPVRQILRLSGTFRQFVRRSATLWLVCEYLTHNSKITPSFSLFTWHQACNSSNRETASAISQQFFIRN